MTDFTPMPKVNCATLPSDSSSEYSPDSDLVWAGRSVTKRLVTNFTFMLPS